MEDFNFGRLLEEEMAREIDDVMAQYGDEEQEILLDGLLLGIMIAQIDMATYNPTNKIVAELYKESQHLKMEMFGEFEDGEDIEYYGDEE